MRITYTMLLLSTFVLPAAARAQAPAPPAFQTAGAFFALSVGNLQESVGWYRDKLGLRVVMQPEPYNGISVAILEGGGLIVELIHNPAAVALRTAAPAITETTHVHGFSKAGIVVEDFDRVLATLRERGVQIVIGPFPARNGQRANAIIRDNAGNLVQFFGK